MSTPKIVEPSACTWCGIARRGHGRQYADAAGWHEWEQPSQEQILARMKARRLQLAVARVGALPVPAGGERTLDVAEEELAGVHLALWDGVQAYARLRLALAAAQRGRRELRARVAELEDAAYGDATVRLFGPVEQIRHLHQALAAQKSRADTLDRLLREKQARVAELESSGGYPPALPWARLMDAEDLADFLDELAASAITHASHATALDEVEKTCATWRLIAEAQHGHNTAPGPDAVTRTFLPVASLREEGPGGEHYPAVHHEYRVSHDLPETGSPSVPKAKPRPKFFQPGHLYAARVGWPGGRERFRFRCDSVTTDPETGKPRAIGQHGTLRTADGEWIWVENGRTFDDWRGGAWTDITDEAVPETGGAQC